MLACNTGNSNWKQEDASIILQRQILNYSAFHGTPKMCHEKCMCNFTCSVVQAMLWLGITLSEIENCYDAY